MTRWTIPIAFVLSGIAAMAGNHIGQAVERSGADFLELVASPGPIALDGLGGMVADPFALSQAPTPIIGSLLAFCVPWAGLLVLLTGLSKGDAQGEEQGSARFADVRELRKFATRMNPDPYNVMLLSRNIGIAVSRRGYDLDVDRNVNVIVFGGSGTGKTLSHVKPNILQMFGNLFVSDPKMQLLPSCGQALVDEGYEVVHWSTNDTKGSMHFNPFAYLVTDLDIIEWVSGFIKLTSDLKRAGGDKFWDDGTELLLASLIAFLRDWAPPEDYNFEGLLMLLSFAAVREEDEGFESRLDLAFKEIETGYQTPEDVPGTDSLNREVAVPGRGPGGRVPSRHVNNTTGLRPGDLRLRDGRYRRGVGVDEDFSLAMYKKFKTAAGRTLKSLLISTHVKFNAIATDEIRSILSGPDELHLERLADPSRKYVIFDSFNDRRPETLGFLHGMLVWQAVDICCRAADSGGGRLERPVQFVLDEFKTLHLPSSIADMISIVRSRNVGISIMLQSVEQLMELYDEHTANSIMGCCSTMLYLGNGDPKTCELVSKRLGQRTVLVRNRSDSRTGLTGGSTGTNEQVMGRPLMDDAEVAKMSFKKTLVMISGADPALDDKYRLKDHPRYASVDPGHEAVLRLGPPVRVEVRRGPSGRLRPHLSLSLPVRLERARYKKPFDFTSYRNTLRAEAGKGTGEEAWHHQASPLASSGHPPDE